MVFAILHRVGIETPKTWAPRMPNLAILPKPAGLPTLTIALRSHLASSSSQGDRKGQYILSLRLLKGAGFIAAMMQPQRKNDPDPHIGQRMDGYRMTFAFGALALVIGSGPRFTLCGLPSKLVQRIAQRFDASQAPMRLGVHAASKQDRRGSPQCLQTPGILVALSVISDF